MADVASAATGAWVFFANEERVKHRSQLNLSVAHRFISATHSIVGPAFIRMLHVDDGIGQPRLP